ncbi:hypothetical protein K438DRAFT_1753919 [Mycena galopus ATCC 62051]|nr:hypothetical protein K438DRAFT_1753919 [Mycena galopus ATCC 62051]
MPVFDSRLGVFWADPKPAKVCQWSDCPDAGVVYKERKMKMCAQCKVSRSCQRSDWSEHKLYCQNPPLLDIGQWMETHKSLFRWAVIEGLRLRSEPSNIVDHGLLVQITRMDRLLKGVAPSPFLLNSICVQPLVTIYEMLRIPGKGPSGRSPAVINAGGIGQGIVVFALSNGTSTLCQMQYHDIYEKPPGEASPSGRGWANVVKGVVNGEIPISLLSRMIEAPSNDASE